MVAAQRLTVYSYGSLVLCKIIFSSTSSCLLSLNVTEM